jgi:hypothetical protein
MSMIGGRVVLDLPSFVYHFPAVNYTDTQPVYMENVFISCTYVCRDPPYYSDQLSKEQGDESSWKAPEIK